MGVEKQVDVDKDLQYIRELGAEIRGLRVALAKLEGKS